EDWSIIRALSENLGKTLPFDSLAALRQKLHATHSHFTQLDSCTPASWDAFGTSGEMSAAPFTASIENFYMTDPISRASETMAACTREFTESGEEATGTNG
ncbi:MAG: NADH-quinone oxidoreductase subunit NuoG, partial [Alphaproteobacteria bacterium]